MRSARLALDIARRPALRCRGGRPHLVPDTDSAIEGFIRRTGCSTYHPTSTSTIGSVVDTQLRVLGINGLRVADASVLPSVLRGNTNAAAIMTAEKAGDLITGRTSSTPAATLDTRPATLSRHPRARLTDLAHTQARAKPGELDELWEALTSVRPEQILGTWRGTALNTSHSAQRRLRHMRWYGKTINSPDNVHPLICRDDQQDRLYSNTEALRRGPRPLLHDAAQLTRRLAHSEG
ncbi:GXWXG domain-containing protein [Streptomyces sp. NPDC006692]|uniref:GXWXG domain-containing protein n=1 Tax=Streptomyces sp. NPDC006692 TaxID=3364758 RepID=UPI0036A5376A